MVKHFLVPYFLALCIFYVAKCSTVQDSNRRLELQPTKQLHSKNQRANYVCPQNNGVFPITGQCSSQYYVCMEGIPYPQTCAPYEIFDPIVLACVYYDQASCKQKYNCTSDGIFPYPGMTCAQFYYICSAGQSYLQYCPMNYVFDPVDLRCKPMANAGCTPPTAATTTTKPTTESTTTKSTTTKSTTTEPTTTEPPTTEQMTTEPTTPEVATTDAPTTKPTTTEQVTTTQSPTTSESTTTEQVTTTQSPTTSEPITTEPTTSDAPTRESTTTETITTKPVTAATTTQPSTEFTCPSNPSATGLYPNPYDCTSFYQCSNGVPYLMHCPGNLYYNPSLQVCDWPQNVDCQQPVQRKGVLLQRRQQLRGQM